MKILVLEDSTASFETIKNILEDQGFSVDRARSIQEGLDFIRGKERPSGLVIDIVIEDDRTAGISFAKQVMEEYPIPFIFLTYHYDDPQMNVGIQELGLGLNYLFSKRMLDNPDAFTASLIKAFELFPFEEKRFEGIKNSMDWRLGFYTRDEDDGQSHEFFSSSEILCFSGNGQGGVEIYTVDGQEPLVFSRHIKQLIPQVEFRWSNFIKLGASYYVNASKIVKLVRRKNGSGILTLKDKTTAITQHLPIAASGVATLYSLGLIVSTKSAES